MTSLHDAGLAGEHATLLRHLASVQQRCDTLLREQAEEIARLRSASIRMRAAIIMRDSALAWAQEDHAALQAEMPGLTKRVTLARQVRQLQQRLQELMHANLHPAPAMVTAAAAAKAVPAKVELSALEASLVAADLVICQTGCLSHGAYWRVQDHCKRTGKPCMLVAQPDKLRIVQIVQPQRDARPDTSATSTAAPNPARHLPETQD